MTYRVQLLASFGAAAWAVISLFGTVAWAQAPTLGAGADAAAPQAAEQPVGARLGAAGGAEATGEALADDPAPDGAAASDRGASFGRVISVRGTAYLEGPGAAFPLVRGMRVYTADTVRTEGDGAVRLLLADRSIVDVGAGTTVSMSGLQRSERHQKVTLRLVVGRLWARVVSAIGDGAGFEVETATAVAGVRGTELIVAADAGGTQVQVVRGLVEVRSGAAASPVELGPMQSVTVNGAGGMLVGTVRQADLDAARADTQPRPQLDPSQRARLRALAGDAEREQPPVGRDAAPPAPPLETEPGVGNGTLRGTITVEDR